MTLPTVTYVITLYNKAAYLPHVLQGLAEQSGDFTKKYVFVDDGSTDQTVSLLKSITAGWDDVVIIQQANAGPACAMNKGLSAVDSEFVKPLDGDDVLMPWATRNLLDALLATQADVAYANMGRQGRYNYRDTPASEFDVLREPDLTFEPEASFLSKSLKNAQTNPTAWLTRSAFVKSVGGSDEGVFVQDYSLELRLAKQGKFVRIDNEIFKAPMVAPDRLSDNEAQALHDVNLAVIRFIIENPDLPKTIRRYALARSASRAWAWARRRGRRSHLSRIFFVSLAAKLGLVAPSQEFEAAVCEPFRSCGRIRLASPTHQASTKAQRADTSTDQ